MSTLSAALSIIIGGLCLMFAGALVILFAMRSRGPRNTWLQQDVKCFECGGSSDFCRKCKSERAYSGESTICGRKA